MDTQKPQRSAGLKIGLMALLMATGLEVRAAPATCEVVEVRDGESIVVLCSRQSEKTVRLAGIDGLAREAFFRTRAERKLADLLLQKQVVVDVIDTDTDGAEVAQVYVGALHVNASLVRNGLARCHNPAPDDGWCGREEAHARSGLRGVWSDPWLSTNSGAHALPAKRRQST